MCFQAKQEPKLQKSREKQQAKAKEHPGIGEFAYGTSLQRAPEKLSRQLVKQCGPIGGQEQEQRCHAQPAATVRKAAVAVRLKDGKGQKGGCQPERGTEPRRCAGFFVKIETSGGLLSPDGGTFDGQGIGGDKA